MFPFGIFPFNVMPQFNPWWPLQSQQARAEMEKNMPEAYKAYMQMYNNWAEFVTKNNPWLAYYNSMVNKDK